jgi:DeoR/GlpR family transcriptional regulator of sugar metabolism
MKAIEIQHRRERILTLLEQQSPLAVSNLVQTLGVSDETVRHDLAILAKQGIVAKRYGQAELLPTATLPPVAARETTESEAKQAIAQAALALITPQMHTIGLDQGSTTALVAQGLSQFHDKTIVTRSLLSLIALKDGDNAFYTPGGYYNVDDMAFQNQNRDAMSDLQLDISFFGSSGVKNRQGTCSSSFTDAEAKQQMHQQSTLTVALLDHTKFEQTSLIAVTPFDQFDYLITDAQTDSTTLAELRQLTHVIVTKSEA